MKSIRLLFTFFLLIFCTSNLLSQENSNFHFKKIQVDDGLSESAIYCIMQDMKGFMWFGTKDGLNRYDGYNFRIFRNNPHNTQSIGNNFIRCIAEGGTNTLYIGTDAGLYIMNTIDESFSKVTMKTDKGIDVTSAVNALHVDKNGNVWIGSMTQGIFIYNPKGQVLKAVELEKYHLGQNAAWSIISDKSGTIWVGTRLGLLRYNANTEKLEAIEGMFSTQDNSKHEILCILDDDKGNLWLGTWDDGMRLYNKQTNEYISLYGLDSRSYYITHVRSIFQYTDKSLLIGSDDGLYLFDLEKEIIKRVDVPQLTHSLSDQNIYSIAKDRENGIWIGTYFGGVNYLNTSLINIETYYPDVVHGLLSGKAVSQFCEDDAGNIWIATEDGGVNFFDTKTKKITQPIQTTYHNTHALLFDNENLWIGTFSRGIDVYNTRTKSLINLRNSAKDENTLNDDCIFSLYKTKKGDIYAGTPVGLNKYNRNDNSFTRITEANGFIYDMKEDDYGNLWVATYGLGALRLDIKNNKWINYDTIQSRNNPIVGSKLTGIYIDNKKRVIFSSEGRGIFIYDYKTDNFKNISEVDGLPNNVIYGVLDDPFGNLWISSNKGLVCFDTSNPRDFKLYNKADGLQSNQFNYKSSYKTRDGKFYFGGINGFNSFFPKDLSESKNRIVPSIEITQINLLDNSDPELEKEIQTNLNKKEQIELPYNKSSFTISYVSLSYISQAKNQYAYKLEGVDTEWNYAGNNKSVTYVSLSPGKYLFKVKASNNDGLWNDQGTEIEIEILPPFWLSLPAKMFYLLINLLIVYFIASYYLKKTKQKQQQQLENFKTEQETLAFKSKIEFFTTIAHEIRTPLSLISAPLEEVISSGEGSNQTHQNLSIIEKNCDRLTILINQLLDFRKMDSTKYIVNPEIIDLRNHINELFERFKKTAQNKKIDFDLQMPADGDFVVVSDEDALTKIIGNLLTNALKFTKDKIVLKLELNSDKSYSVSVEDNGRGIADNHKDLIFDPFYQVQKDDGNVGTGIGLSLVKHLTEILKAKIEVKNGDKGGTIFTFTFSDIPKDMPRKKEETDGDLYSENIVSARDKKEMILVVDDNPEMILFIKNCIQNQYSVDTALDASEALSLMEEKSYDLIISDIMMPGIDGISFTKKVRADINYSHIPVILLSAKTENTAKVEGLQSGADVFIEKPFSTSYLKAQISSLLENRRAMLDAFNRSPMASYSALATNKGDEAFLNRLNEEIEKHISDETFSVESLTDILSISRSNLQRKLKGISGVTPGDYLRNYRLKRACKLLLETDMRINEVAFYVGFNSASYFTKAFYKCYQMSPKEFVNKMGKN
ncbi:MAG: response regulator [Prevotella sp.]|nr:response regulator [Prevotella sp.]